VHYTAALYFDPAQAAYSDFDPFWQFVSGPLHAGGFGPNALDATFGPQQLFVKSAAGSPTPRRPRVQFFGQVSIDAASSVPDGAAPAT